MKTHSKEFTLKDREEVRKIVETGNKQTHPSRTAELMCRLFKAYTDLLCQQYPIKVPLRRPDIRNAIRHISFTAEENDEYREASATFHHGKKKLGEVFFTIDADNGAPIVYLQTDPKSDSHTMIVRLDGKNYENGKPYRYCQEGI